MTRYTFLVKILPTLVWLMTVLYQLYFWWFWRRKKRPLRRYLELFLNLEKFVRRAREDFQEKLRIGRYVRNYLLTRSESNLVIFLESGTTAAEIGFALSESQLRTYTNNLLVGLAYAGKKMGDFCHLLPGCLDHEYPGIVGPETVQRLKSVLGSDCILAIMNATSFEIDGGPCVRSDTNQEIKRCILDHAQEILICFASSKILHQDTPKKKDPAPSIYSAREWEEKLKSRNIHLIIGAPSRLRIIKYARLKERVSSLVQYLKHKEIPCESRESGPTIWHIESPAVPISKSN